MGTVGLSYSPLGSLLELSTPLNLARGLFSPDMAMDLGTANTLIYVKGRGITLNEPSLVAVDELTGEVVGVGHEARAVFGKTSRQTRCARPMKDGVIADFRTTATMIRTFIARVTPRFSLRKPRMVIGVPSGITQVEKRAVIEAATCAGVGEVRLVEEPMAAAIGAGLPIDKAIGNMIVDIGGGTTEVAIISLKGTAYSQSIRVAGDEMDEAIERYIRRTMGVEVGIFEAERIKIVAGSALPLGKPRTIPACGRNVGTGHPVQVEISDQQIREALREPVEAIISSIQMALEHTTPEIAHDVLTRGIWLAGGGALLKGLTERLHRETAIQFHLVSDPLSCVARGVGTVVEHLREMRELCIA